MEQKIWESDTQKAFSDGKGGYSVVNKKTGNTEKFDKNGKKLAEGGIITKPTYALMGEAGTEAVLNMKQLTNLFNMLNNPIQIYSTTT